MPFGPGTPLNIALTGAAGQISYSFLPHLLDGSIFGDDQLINIFLLEIPSSMKLLEGVRMELEDCAFKNLNKISLTSSADDAFNSADLIILIGSSPRREGMERRDLIRENSKIFINHAKSINRKASKDCKVVVVGNPINTNALIIAKFAPNLKMENITALMQLDQSRAQAHLKIFSNQPKNPSPKITVWGNHSKNLYPDISNINCSLEEKEAYLSLIRERGSMVIKKRGRSSALSAAQAIKTHLINLFKGSLHCTMAVNTGLMGYPSLGICGNLFFGMPVVIESPFQWKIDWDSINPSNSILKEEIEKSVKELIDEREEVLSLLNDVDFHQFL